MGLDIYLYRYENRKETEALEAQYNNESKKNWEFNGRSYSDLTDAEKQEAEHRDKHLASSLGLNGYGEDDRKQAVELVSQYPDHYFKIGYLRSSYNGGGINRVLMNLGLPSLYEIFGREDNDDYVWAPDWEMSLIRVKEVIEQLKAMPKLRCFTVSPNELAADANNTIESELDAMRVYSTERESSFSDGYSNIHGYFYHKEPLKIYGLVQGFRKALFGDRKFPCVYVIQEGENEWYIQALEITQATIEYVLSQPDKDKYFLHWSS
jgi:hypothetical protein